MDSPPYSPLVDIAMNCVNVLNKKLSPEQLSALKNIFIQFVSGKISYQECSGQIIPIISTTTPLDKIDEIIRTSDWPLPPLTVGKPNDPLSNSRAKTRQWAAYEDQRLLAGIHRYGLNDWSLIARFVGNGRTKSQCAQRWLRVLDPQISKEQWNDEQDSTLLQLISILGDKSWTKISQFMDGRSDVQCRYRYHQLQKEDNFQQKFNEASELAKSKDDLLKNPHIKPKQRRKSSHNIIAGLNYPQNTFQQPIMQPPQNIVPTYQPNIPPPVSYKPPENIPPPVQYQPQQNVARPVQYPQQQNVTQTIQYPQRQNVARPAQYPQNVAPQGSFDPQKMVYKNVGMQGIEQANHLQHLVNMNSITHDINPGGVVINRNPPQISHEPISRTRNVFIQPTQMPIEQPIHLPQIPRPIPLPQTQLPHTIQIPFPVPQQSIQIQQSQLPFQRITNMPHIEPQQSMQFDFEISSQNSMTDWANIRSSASGYGITQSDSIRNL